MQCVDFIFNIYFFYIFISMHMADCSLVSVNKYHMINTIGLLSVMYEILMIFL